MDRTRDDGNVAEDLARELADVAAQLASLKGEAYTWLSAPEIDTGHLAPARPTVLLRR